MSMTSAIGEIQVLIWISRFFGICPFAIHSSQLNPEAGQVKELTCLSRVGLFLTFVDTSTYWVVHVQNCSSFVK